MMSHSQLFVSRSRIVLSTPARAPFCARNEEEALCVEERLFFLAPVQNRALLFLLLYYCVSLYLRTLLRLLLLPLFVVVYVVI